MSVGAADFGIEDVVPLVTTLVRLGILVLLPLGVVDLGHGAVTIILLPLEDITQGFYMFLSELNYKFLLPVDFCMFTNSLLSQVYLSQGRTLW